MNYPQEFPIEDVQSVIAILLRNKESTPPVIAKSLWVTTGYILKVVLGDPSEVQSLGAATDVLSRLNLVNTGISDTDGAVLLHAICEAECRERSGSAVEYKINGLDLGTLVTGGLLKSQLAKLLLPFLLDKLKSWLMSGGLEAIFMPKSHIACAHDSACCR